jgi:hypothetical protein
MGLFVRFGWEFMWGNISFLLIISWKTIITHLTAKLYN